MENKKVIDMLEYYFVTQCDPKVVARTLGACMVDINRIKHIKSLSENEKKSLFERIDKNCKQLSDFIQNGATEQLKYIAENSE
jgi:hypothetical protein